MIVISSAELRDNMEKYLDLSTIEPIIIQRGKAEAFVLSKQERLLNTLTGMERICFTLFLRRIIAHNGMYFLMPGSAQAL